MRKLIFGTVILSSLAMSYNVLGSWYQGDKKMYKVSCSNGDWGYVTDFGKGLYRYWSSSPNQGYETFDKAARSLCGE